MIPIENLPFKFTDEFNASDECVTFDQRNYCQMVEQSDRFTIVFKATRCFDCNNGTGVPCTFTIVDVDPTGWLLNEGSGTTAYYKHITGNVYPLTHIASSSTGYYEITFTIKQLSTDDIVGSVSVKIGNTTYSEAFDIPGTYKIYIQAASSGALQFIPTNDFNGQVGEIGWSKIESSYILSIYNLENTLVKQVNITNKIKDIFYLVGSWSDFELSDGCYYLKLNSCPNLIDVDTLDVESTCPSGCSIITSDTPVISISGSVNTSADSFYIHQDILVIGQCYDLTFDLIPPGPNIDLEYRWSFGTNVGAWTAFPSEDLTITMQETCTGNATFALEIRGTDLNVDGDEFNFYNIILRACGCCIESSPSGCYDLKTIHSCTKLLHWTNDDDAFGIPYSEVSFTHYLRVFAIKDRPRYQEEMEQFKNSAGSKKINYASREKIWRLFFDYLPEYLHDAISLAKIHDHFYVDGIEYVCLPGNYEPEWRGNLRLAQGQMDIQKKIDNNINYNCL
jgi:hypothetical protein